MQKTPVYIDEIVNIDNLTSSVTDSTGKVNKKNKMLSLIIVGIAISVMTNIFIMVFGSIASLSFIRDDEAVTRMQDEESNCYLWYNTDVSPNLWQYWYDDIAGDNYYGWMECEGADWYIEVSDTEWEKFDGDTSGLWHIENPFD